MRSDKKIILLLVFLFSISGISAQNDLFDSANSAYSKGNYKSAVKLYEDILAQGQESAELYYNLGNACYKNNDVAHAILNYERAKKLAPEDEDVLSNLKLANLKVEDKIETAPQLFLSEWKSGIISLFSERQWGVITILLFLMTLVAFLIYYVSGKKVLKQSGFLGGIILLLITILTFWMGIEKYHATVNKTEAIIVAPSVTVTGSPNEKGTALFILHEGAKVNITEESSEWTEVRIANGNVGWIRSSALEKI